MLIAALENSGDSLTDQLIVLIKATGQAEAIAVIERLYRPKRQGLQIADQGFGCTVAPFIDEAIQLTIGIVSVVDAVVRGIGKACQSAICIIKW